jgi:DNA polymerase III delta prime subunit
METYAKYCRFILTANYKHKIIPALQSRCQSLSIKPVVELAVKRCYNILKDEKVKVPEEQKKKFVQLVKRHFPDLRKTINELQKNVIDSELCITSIVSDNELLETIYKKVASKSSLEARRYLIENEDRFQGDYDTLLCNYLDFVYSSNVEDIKKKEMIAIIADHLYKSAFVVDKEINAFACLVNLEKV